MKKKIRVTREDIRRGRSGRTSFCPIEIALSRQVGSGQWLANVARLYEADGERTTSTPRSVSRFIRRFDRELSVEPFTFIIDLPAPEPKSGS